MCTRHTTYNLKASTRRLLGHTEARNHFPILFLFLPLWRMTGVLELHPSDIWNELGELFHTLILRLVVAAVDEQCGHIYLV